MKKLNSRCVILIPGDSSWNSLNIKSKTFTKTTITPHHNITNGHPLPWISSFDNTIRIFVIRSSTIARSNLDMCVLCERLRWTRALIKKSILVATPNGRVAKSREIYVNSGWGFVYVACTTYSWMSCSAFEANYFCVWIWITKNPTQNAFTWINNDTLQQVRMLIEP